ncbi:MAG: xanthine dehydrogenase family protein subunit M [Vampirovibrionia bacterium]
MEYLNIQSLENACNTLKKNYNSKVLAGGTDLLVQLRHKKINPDLIIDIKNIEMLSGIKSEDNYLVIGACTKLNEIAENPKVQKDYRAISQAASEVGCYQIRNRATIGGNLCNASPAADSSPSLLCMDAVLTYFYNGDFINCPVKDFFKGPGKTVLPSDAILCSVKVPDEYAGAPSVYMRHSRRKSLDLSTISVAVVNKDNKFAIALGSVAPTVIRVPEAEEILNNEGLTLESIAKAAEAAKNSCTPISDLRGSKEYRSEMVRNYTKKALESLMEG